MALTVEHRYDAIFLDNRNAGAWMASNSARRFVSRVESDQPVIFAPATGLSSPAPSPALTGSQDLIREAVSHLREKLFHGPKSA